MPLEFDSFRYRPTEIRTIYTFRCIAPGCESETKQEWNGEWGHTPSWPTTDGKGWQPCGENVYLCPKHEVTVYLDGKLWTVNGVLVGPHDANG